MTQDCRPITIHDLLRRIEILENIIKPPCYNACPVCKINLTGVMGYVCNNPKCPVFPVVTC